MKMFHSHDICCLKMASRCRPQKNMIQLEGNRLPALGSSHHDCGSLEQVVMTRKRDQRQVINHSPSGQRQSQTVTYETYQTFRGHRPQNTVVYREAGGGEDGSGNDDDPGQDPLTVSLAATGDAAVSESTNGRVRSQTTTTTTRGGDGGGSISNLLKPHSSMRSSSCSPYASKKGGLNGAVSTSSLASRSQVTTMPTTSTATFAADCARAHNEYRQRHRVPDLKLSASLCKYSQEWADTLARRGVLQSRGGTRYGENIFCVQSSSPVDVHGRDPVDNWYKEAKNHVFGREPSTLKTGHFSQVVWRESRELGVGIARNRNGQIFVVANYDPPGNVIGSFADNVPPIGGDHQAAGDQELRREDKVRMRPKGQRDYVASRSVSIVSNHTTGAASETVNSDDATAFKNAILKHHNDFRRKHNVPDLHLDSILNATAQSWAHNLAQSDKFGHNPSTKYGENIYCMWSSDRNASPNPKDVCRSWYDEIRDFNFGYEPKGRVTTAHFSQMVWKSSQRLGVGIAKTRTGKVVVVCNYDPSGNISGHYNANVPRPAMTTTTA